MVEKSYKRNVKNPAVKSSKNTKKDTKNDSKHDAPDSGGIIRRLPYKILLLSRKGVYAAQIMRQLNIPRTTAQDNLSKLHAKGFVKLEVRSSSKIYKITPEGEGLIKQATAGFSRHLRQGKKRLHRMDIKLPIMKDNPNAKFDRINDKFNGWSPEYTTATFPIGITFKRTPKNIILKFHEFETGEERLCMTEFFSHVMRGVFFANTFLRTKYGIETGIPEEVLSQHVVNERPDLKGKVDEKKTTAINLGRNAKSFLPTNMKATAWMDYSKGDPEIETNCFVYEEKVLEMPETVAQMQHEIDELKGMMQGFLPQQLAISNATNMNAVTLKKIAESQRMMVEAYSELNDTMKKLAEKKTVTKTATRKTETVSVEYDQ